MRQSRRTQQHRQFRYIRPFVAACFVVSVFVLSGTAAAASGSTGLSIRIDGWPLGASAAPRAASVSGAQALESTSVIAGTSAHAIALGSEPDRLAHETVSFSGASHSVAAPQTAIVRCEAAEIEVSRAAAMSSTSDNGVLRVGLSGMAQVPPAATAGEYEGDILVILSWE